MNIAFTTLVILILAVPGYIARSAYQTDKFTRDVLQRDITSDIVLAILYSIPFHFLGTAVINHLNLAGYTSARIDFDALFRLLAGQYGKDGQEFSRLSNNIYQHIHVIAIYFGCLVAVAFGTGIFLR